MKQLIKNKFNEITANKTFMVCALLTTIYLISGYCKWLEIMMSVCALGFMIVLPLQNAFCIFIYLHCFTLSNIGYDSCFIVTLIGFCLILLVKYWLGVKKGEYTLYKKTISILCFFLSITLVISLFRPLYRGAWLYLTYIPFIYFVFAMRKEFNIDQGMNYMFGGLLTSGLLATITLIFPGFQYIPFTDGRFSAFINNTNYMYMRALFVLAYFMYRFLNKDISKWKFLVIFITCGILTMASLSKTGIAMFALLCLAFVVLFLKQDFKNNIRIVSIFFIILLIMSAICFKFILAIINRFVSDFKGGNFWDSLLTGRNEIWSCYLSACFSSPFKFLFGHGLLAHEVYIPSQMQSRASHNLYIFMLYRFGLIGCIFIGLFIYKIIKSAKLNKPQFIVYLPMLFLLVESLFDNTFKCYHFTYFVFATMILFADKILKQDSKDNKKKEMFEQINKN